MTGEEQDAYILGVDKPVSEFTEQYFDSEIIGMGDERYDFVPRK